MACIHVRIREEGLYNPGTPGFRGKTAVPNAENFVALLESKGWKRNAEQPDEDIVRLSTEWSSAIDDLQEYGSKPVLKDQTPAWRIREKGS